MMKNVPRLRPRLIMATLVIFLVAIDCITFAEEARMSPQTVPPESELTAEQQEMVRVWEQHIAAEFQTKSLDSTLGTMTEHPFLNHVPVITGGNGLEEIRRFYGTYFIPGHPSDTKAVLLSRTVGRDRIVDEMIHTFTHAIEMPWILPGIEPTGKHVELPVVVIVEFRDGKIQSEHIYWDQATVLAQIGLLDTKALPIAGVEAAHKLQDPVSVPSNELIKRSEETKPSR